jgi:hypothetical protein
MPTIEGWDNPNHIRSVVEKNGEDNKNVATLLWPSVRIKLTLPKLGTWSPPGLPKIQSLIAGVKTPRIGGVFDIIGKVSKCRCPK